MQKDGQHFLKEMKRVRFMNNQHTSHHFSIQSTWKCSTNVLHSLLVCLCFSMSYAQGAELPWFWCSLTFLCKCVVRLYTCVLDTISQAFQSFTTYVQCAVCYGTALLCLNANCFLAFAVERDPTESAAAIQERPPSCQDTPSTSSRCQVHHTLTFHHSLSSQIHKCTAFVLKPTVFIVLTLTM